MVVCRDEALSSALLAAGLPVVTMPQPITRLLVHHLPDLPALVTPQLVRDRLRGQRQEPSTSPQQVSEQAVGRLGLMGETKSGLAWPGLAVVKIRRWLWCSWGIDTWEGWRI